MATVHDQPEDEPEAQPGAPPRVLLVDDDPDFLASFRELLEQEGFVVTTATHGAEALAAASAQTPDAVVCDLCLPSGDGFDVVERLRADPAMQDVPIFAVTGVADLEDADTARAALGAGFAGLFPKPVNWPALRRLLRVLLAPRPR